jgi:uncharacterized membrane protein YgaE (UPF0421/DUF939 family)
MWFWLMLILTGIGVGAIILGNWMYNHTKFDTNWLIYAGVICAVIFGLITLVMGIVIIDAHTNLEAKIAANEQIYDSLVYQLENELYENDNDLGKKELYNQIQEWNKDLAYRQNAQDDFWNGIFYSNIYDQFEYITLPKSVS